MAHTLAFFSMTEIDFLSLFTISIIQNERLLCTPIAQDKTSAHIYPPCNTNMIRYNILTDDKTPKTKISLEQNVSAFYYENNATHSSTKRVNDAFRDPFSFSPENQMSASLVVLPGGLHAILIRSALTAMRVYEQTVTGLGWTQTTSTGAWRGRERR